MISKEKNRIMILYGHHQNSGGVVNLYQKFNEQIQRSNYEIHHERVGRIQRSKFLNIFLFRISDLAYNYIKFIIELIRIKPAIIHLNPSLNKKAIYRDFLYLFISQMIIKNIKILIHIHGWEENLASDFKSKNTFNAIFINMINKANAIIVLASQFKESMMDIIDTPQKIIVMPTAVDVVAFQIAETPARKDGLKVLFLSRIIRNKGVFEIADSIERIIKKNQQLEIKFILAGDGEDKKALESYVINKKVDKYVEFPGYVKGKDKADLFKASDLFIFPSYHAEGCPVAVLEAMAAGLPVVSTNVAALKEIIINGINGIIIEKQSAEQIVDAVNLLVNDIELMEKMGHNNRTRAKAEFDVPVIFKKLNRIYDNLIDS
jgi:glycosyltransferase involved in cell wall biosynthesis